MENERDRRQQLHAVWRGVSVVLEEWDPLGVHEHGENPEFTEYDDLIPAVVRSLGGSDAAEEVAANLRAALNSYYGVDVDTSEVAQKVVREWSHVRYPTS